MTFLGVEPLDVLRFESPDGLVRYITLGCSRHPMGDPNELVADPTRGPRAELVLTLRGGTGIASGVARTLAVLAAAPSVEGVVLLEDALLDLGEPLWKDTAFTAVLLGDSGIEDLTLPEPFDPVRFLGVVPLTGTEAAWVRLRGAEALREAWTEAGIDIRDPHRSRRLALAALALCPSDHSACTRMSAKFSRLTRTVRENAFVTIGSAILPNTPPRPLSLSSR